MNKEEYGIPVTEEYLKDVFCVGDPLTYHNTMKTEEQLEAWASVLGFAYDNLSATEFDYLLRESPFSTYRTGVGADDPDEWFEHQPFETHDLEATLYFQ